MLCNTLPQGFIEAPTLVLFRIQMKRFVLTVFADLNYLQVFCC